MKEIRRLSFFPAAVKSGLELEGGGDGECEAADRADCVDAAAAAEVSYMNDEHIGS